MAAAEPKRDSWYAPRGSRCRARRASPRGPSRTAPDARRRAPRRGRRRPPRALRATHPRSSTRGRPRSSPRRTRRPGPGASPPRRARALAARRFRHHLLGHVVAVSEVPHGGAAAIPGAGEHDVVGLDAVVHDADRERGLLAPADLFRDGLAGAGTGSRSSDRGRRTPRPRIIRPGRWRSSNRAVTDRSAVRSRTHGSVPCTPRPSRRTRPRDRARPKGSRTPRLEGRLARGAARDAGGSLVTTPIPFPRSSTETITTVCARAGAADASTRIASIQQSEPSRRMPRRYNAADSAYPGDPHGSTVASVSA